MSMHVNLVLFTGRLTREPDLRKAGPTRQFPDGMPVCNITLAQNSRVKGEDGKWVDGDPIFVDVAIWGKRAEAFAAHHKKGDEAYIQGKLRFDSWEDKETHARRTKLKVDADEWQFVPRGAGTTVGESGGVVRGDDTPF